MRVFESIAALEGIKAVSLHKATNSIFFQNQCLQAIFLFMENHFILHVFLITVWLT